MSSSLDDLEPYELFQHELDEHLVNYEAALAKSGNENFHHQVLIINTFIEYLCFIKSKSDFQEVIAEEINTEFMDFFDSKSEDKTDPNEVIEALGGYLNFIHNFAGKPSLALIKSIKF